ncbi:MAG TPA: hypothetical protein VNK52_15090 [Hyphomicrobiaceae bacterium]|nr:hypothetical protein [Hyphomicrobiaceae bacterium]
MALLTSDLDVSTFLSNNLLWLSLALIAATIVLFKGRQIASAFERALASNWQLVLLATTGIVLSLASGYTTFDGMRNFTQAPLLSVMISFGIQGVMLIVAWLIGESFATQMNHRPSNGGGFGPRDAMIGMLLALALVGITFYWALQQFEAVTVTGAATIEADWHRFADVAFYYALALIVIALIAFNFSRGGDLARPYVQSARIIAKNLVLWVMFLATMAASVFFSFDSHFNAIFPAEQRARAAEIRTTGQVGAVIADIGALTQKRQIEEAESLFASEGWRTYDGQLTRLAEAAQGSQGEIERYFVRQMEERRRAINEQQERIATAQSGQAGLANRKISLTEELSRLKAERPGLAAEYADRKSELDAKAREVDAKRVEAMAEDRGVEGTMKQGKGPVYRERMAELAVLQDQYKIGEERANNARKRLTSVETRIAQIERELSAIDGDLAKLKGEEETALHRIRAVEAALADQAGQRLDPARVLTAFERARAEFRRQPDTERLAALQQQCTNLLNAMLSNPVTKERVRAVDCDPKQAAEAAARVFALNAGLAAFQAKCAGGDKLARYTSTDALLGFGRQCLQDSGLVSKDAADIGARLAAIDMNRDDKAHRFVVTWNAFLDGNRLAYLALMLAIGVDALVFLSGLFGAQALRSPLSDVPSPKARSAEQLEAIVKNALGEERLENAELVLSAMQPIGIDGDNRSVVDLSGYDYESARRIRKVLVAGASIGAVERDPSHPEAERYLVRSELFEYLSVVANSARETDRDYTNRTRLIQIVGVALEPDRRRNAETVLEYLEPINQRHGFMAKVELDAVASDHRRLVQTVLNAAMTLDAVQRHDRGGAPKAGPLGRLLARAEPLETTYLVRSDLFKVLLLYRAGSPSLITDRAAARHSGGVLREEVPAAIADGRGPNRLPAGARPGNGSSPPLHNGHGHPAGDDLEQHFVSQIMQRLGLPPHAYGKLRAEEIAAQAVAAAHLFKRQARTHMRLHERLSSIESNLRRELSRAHTLLANEYEGQGLALERLAEVVAAVNERIPALMLLPESGVLADLIEQLDEASAGDGGLRPGEDVLRDRLRRLEDDLRSMNAAEGSVWSRIEDSIARLSDSGPMDPITGALNGKPSVH